MPPLPHAPLELVEEAVNELDALLELRVVGEPTTHIALVVEDMGHPDIPPALGRYLVAVVAGAIDEDAQLSEELLAREADSVAEVRTHLERLLGPDNVFDDRPKRTFRDTARNPWIAEILAHALLVLRRRRETLCIEGSVVALKQPHTDPRKQGLDLVAVYADEDGLAGLALGEAKASRQYGPRRLTEAATFFASIDDGKRGIEIRQEVQALRHVLPPELRATLADGFWRDRCCYLPLIVFSAPPINETEDHAGLGGLIPPVRSRRLFAFRIKHFHEFFNQVANAAREAVEEMFADV